MQHEQLLDEARILLDMVERRSTSLTDSVMKLDAAGYADPGLFQRLHEVRKGPWIGLPRAPLEVRDRLAGHTRPLVKLLLRPPEEGARSPALCDGDGIFHVSLQNNC